MERVFQLPYGAGAQTLTLGDGFDVEVLRSLADLEPDERERDEDRIVLDAMANPAASHTAYGTQTAADGAPLAADGCVSTVNGTQTAADGAPVIGGGPRLCELARGKRSAVVICSDHTRPVPSRRILPHMLRELRAGSPGIEITLLVATGLHRATSRDELAAKFGPEIFGRERIVIHDCADSSAMRRLGRLPSGAELAINRIAADTELLVAEGFIEPHFFAGFSGGRKSVLPGICAYETVLGNHCAQFIADPAARTGTLTGNPIHRDMLAAQRLAKLAYIVNVIIDGEKRVLRAFAGDPEAAHAAGCAALRALCSVKPSQSADIVITTNGGAPLDQNIYQAVKGMTAAEAVAAPGAVIVVAAACGDGTGGDSFYRMLRGCGDPARLLDEIGRVPMERTEPDQWQVQILARVLSKHKVILVCEPGARTFAREMKLLTAADADEAFSQANALWWAARTTAPTARPRVTVIPNGVSVIVGPPADTVPSQTSDFPN
ncbi:MAG: nickel-dependent lactate racemase [Clostridiales bacterium]|jgi:nickel-dependent lactate racemase|nr:nickel-dependent lactate racemase [Clostridiales bacterium]